MKLADYLEGKGESRASFARRVSLSPGLITQLCQGQTWVSRKTATKIIEATGGDVTPNDFMIEAAAE